MLFGAIGIIPIWYIRFRPIKDTFSIKIAVLCGIFFACDIALWNTSILLTKSSIATLIANLAPVWVGLGAMIILKEKQPMLFWLGTIVSFVGMILIVGVYDLLHTHFNMGYLLAMIASVFYGCYILTTRRGRIALDTVAFTGISIYSSTIVLLLLCLISGTQLGGFSPKTWYSLIGLGLISQLGGWLAINFALGYIKPTLASATLLSQSVLTAIFAIPVLGEVLNIMEITGAIVVLTGIYLVNKKPFENKS